MVRGRRGGGAGGEERDRRRRRIRMRTRSRKMRRAEREGRAEGWGGGREAKEGEREEYKTYTGQEVDEPTGRVDVLDVPMAQSHGQNICQLLSFC